MYTAAFLRKKGLLSLQINSVLILVVFWFSCTSAWAAPTTAEEAKTVVQNWLSLDKMPLGASLGQDVGEVTTFADKNKTPLYFIVYLKPQGFAIVSGDDLVEPIVGFISQGKYVPESTNPLGALVLRDLPGRVAAVRTMEQQTLMQGKEFTPLGLERAAKGKWDRLKAAAPEAQTLTGLGSVADVRVPPLVQSRWSQSTEGGTYCYNYYTPNHYVCGCVATAMSQLMRYHQYPTLGVGTTAFTIYVDNIPQSRNLRGGNGSGGPYNWASMVLDPDYSTSDVQRQAIGALTHDAGLSVNMKYTAGSSGASHLGATSLVSTFKYTNAREAVNNSNIPSAALYNMINANLDASLPVLLGIFGYDGGHAIVADGYGYNYATLYHHLNLGWAGSDDAWYNLPTIDSNPSFETVARCAYNIYPTGTGEIISGRVTDANGNPVSGAAVSAARVGGGVYNSTTNSRGIYALAKVPAASTYSITVTKAGQTFSPRTVNTATSYSNTVNTGNLWAVNFSGAGAGLAPGEAVDNKDLTFSTGGDASWFGETATSYFGGSAAQSGDIGDNQTSWFQTSIAGPGTLSFYWKVSSEVNYDFLEVYIDNVLQYRISGEVDWQQKSFTLSAGVHTVKWVYSKDVSVSTGSDCGWVDKVEFKAGGTTLTLSTVLDNPDLTFATGGSNVWFGQTATAFFGGSAAQSGDIADAQSSWVQTTIDGPGILTFDWKVSSETGYDFLKILVDNNEIASISGTQDWQAKSIVLPSGSHSVKWSYDKDTSVSTGSDCGWLDKVAFVQQVPLTLGAALDNLNLSFSTNGNALWFGQTAVATYGGSAAQTGDIADNQSSSVETTVTGPGTLSFYWKISSEANYDYLNFLIDGVAQPGGISGEMDWQQKTFNIPAGTHNLKWSYSKDGSVSTGSDCGWLDKVTFSGASGSGTSLSPILNLLIME